jgi:hypothetical protein
MIGCWGTSGFLGRSAAHINYVGVVVSKNPVIILIVQGERVLQAMRPQFIRLNLGRIVAQKPLSKPTVKRFRSNRYSDSSHFDARRLTMGLSSSDNAATVKSLLTDDTTILTHRF